MGSAVELAGYGAVALQSFAYYTRRLARYFVRSSLRTVYAEQTEICNHPIPSLPRCDAIFEGIDRLLVTWIALTTWSWTMVVHRGSQTGRARTRTTSTPVERNLT